SHCRSAKCWQIHTPQSDCQARSCNCFALRRHDSRRDRSLSRSCRAAVDTVGISETTDPIELEGVRRARERATGADLVLWVVDSGVAMTGSAALSAPAEKESAAMPIWLVRNKIDLLENRPRNEDQCQSKRSNESDCRFTEPLR